MFNDIFQTNQAYLYNQMKKTTFAQKFQKAIKFYDFSYHVHKSTFKGLSSFYKLYTEVQRNYADSLMNLTKQIWTQIPELAKENQTLVYAIKQIINCIQTTSQLHFNYAQRLEEVGIFYNGEYLGSKKRKDNHMKILKDRNEQQYVELKQRQKNRHVLNNKEKQICKILYQNLNKLSEQENDRIHKVKQQTIIYFSLYKKVCEKQLQSTSEHNLKLVKQDFQVKNPKIAQIAQQIRNQFNQYGGQQIQRRSYDLNTPMIFNRQSLRASMAFKQRISRVSQTQNKLKNTVEKYRTEPDNLQVMTQDDQIHGLFDGKIFGKEQRRKFARELNGHIIKNIAYDMMQSYYKAKGCDSDQMMLLQLIKSILKYKSKQSPKFSNLTLQKHLGEIKLQITDKQYLFHVCILQQLSILNKSNESKLKQHSKLTRIIQKYRKNQITQEDISNQNDSLNYVIKCCILDILLDCTCSIKDQENVLVDSFIDYMHLVANFGEQFLIIGRQAVAGLVMRKLQRLLKKRNEQEELQLLITDQYFLQASKIQKPALLLSTIQTWSTILLNSVTQHLINFYTKKTSLTNSLKILMILQKIHLLPISLKFNARDHFYACIRSAGFNYLSNSQQCLKTFNGDIIGEQRLKDIVEGIEQLDYQGVIKNYLSLCSQNIAKLLGVGEKIVKNKLFEQFTYSLYEIINANLELLSQQEGIDREGYILRLGTIFAKLDIQNPQLISEYQTFFKVLKIYLQATQKDYDKLLQHSRKTQLWIMQENALATPNCIDFCSLLYKPFQFLLISLKELERAKKTQYTGLYAEYIKLRLNTVLKNQIIKYINFLYQSLTPFRSHAPQITLKPKRMLTINLLAKQSLQKQRQLFKQLTRRLFNLLFLKQQLQQMVQDFLQPQLYKQLDNSILNINKLNKIISQAPKYRDILSNVKEIAQAVIRSQEMITRKVANIVVFQNMGKIWDNIYYQQQKNAIQQFFSNSADYKLSQYTFTKYQQCMQDWFSLISKNIPQEFYKDFQLNFLKSLYLSIQFQTINSTKFKIPLKQSQVIPYLDADVTFLTTLMKNKFTASIIQQQLKTPYKTLLIDLQYETQKLMSMLQSASLRNDREQCRYILAILNLRIKDQKAIEFVKKYKSLTQN